MLVDNSSSKEMIFAMKSPTIPGLTKRKFKQTKSDNFLAYTFEDPGKVKVIKKYEFYNSLDYIVLDVSTKNISSEHIYLSYQLNGPTNLKQVSQVAGRSFLEACTMENDKLWKVKSGKALQKKTGQISWTGIKNRYFALIVKPENPEKTIAVETMGAKNLAITIESPERQLAPGETRSEKYLLYAGPLDEKRIEAAEMDIKGLVDYGFFGGVSKVLLSVLKFFHKITKNWGVAIILLTIGINIVMFPLTYKSFSSMQQMKQVQPHMQKLRDLHKDNPQKLNKEMMELYKKHKVNPLGGCLPMVLQMPIFLALYQGLIRSISLKGASFLWIADLAKPDGVPLPGKLPFIGNTVNILPLIMVGVMILQQKISQKLAPAVGTSAEQEKQQKMITMMMPIFFGFLFYRMPSGLVLYWLTNTVLMTIEQGFIAKRSNA